MYRIIGADGKEYGPIGIEQMRQWITEGRVNARSHVQAAGAADWKTAAEFPELGLAPAPGAGAPPPSLPTGQPSAQQNGLAITSLVLGVLSLVCFGLLAGIPAIICGHLARGRARCLPGRYGGAGFALAGLIMGYVSLVLTFAVLLPAFARAKAKAQRITCTSYMCQIGLAFRIWAIDHDDCFPFNVSTNNGGTLELCLAGSDGFDRNATFHFRVMSNELSTPYILVCPADTRRQRARNFLSLQPANVTYQVYSGTNVTGNNPEQVLAVCPIHHIVVLCDGSVQQERPARR